MQLVQEIQEKLQRDSVSVLKMSNDTGISAYKIYKWLAGKGNPKAEDAAIIKKWLGGNVDKVPNSNNGNGAQMDTNTPLTGAVPTLQDYINEIKDSRDKWYNLVNSILGHIEQDTKTALAYQKAWIEYEAEKVSGGDEKSKLELMNKMSNIVRGYLLGRSSIHNETESGKTGKA